jgi:hypothetical protein
MKDMVMPEFDITIDNVDERLGRLTGDKATRILFALNSPLAGWGSALVSMFDRENVSAWLGLAIIGAEASFGINHGFDADHNRNVDERNIANPFSVYFNNPKQWPVGCGRNSLLKHDVNGRYNVSDKKYDGKTINCSAVGYRLPTFGESASGAIQTIKRKGIRSYSESKDYVDRLNRIFNSIAKNQENIISGKK